MLSVVHNTMKSVLFSLALFFAKTAYGQDCSDEAAACEHDSAECLAVMEACDSDCTGETCRDDCEGNRLTLLAIGADGGEVGAALLACIRTPDPDAEPNPCDFGDGDRAVLESACTWDTECYDLRGSMPDGPPRQDWLDSSGW